MEELTLEQKYIQQLQKEQKIIRKKVAIYHNGLIDMQLLFCKDIPASDRLKEIIFLINKINIDVANVTPQSTLLIV